MRKTIEDYGIEHVGYVVKDLGKTIEHFKSFYGIKDFQMYDFSPTKAWSYGKKVDNYRLKIAMAQISDTTCKVEIIQPVSGEGVHRDFVEAGNSGMHHVAFRVEEYDYWRQYFIDKGTEFVFESETEDDVIGFRRCFYAYDKEVDMIFEIKEIPYFRKK